MADNADIDISASFCRSDGIRKIALRHGVEFCQPGPEVEDIDKWRARCGCERAGERAVDVRSFCRKYATERLCRPRIDRSERLGEVGGANACMNRDLANRTILVREQNNDIG